MFPYSYFNIPIFSFSSQFSDWALYSAPVSTVVVGVVEPGVVGGGVVVMQEGGVQNPCEKSPVAPYTWE